ncbi:hypothetical protein MMC30_007991 [Trapelia coarctata]|nr:hypothetical protein [Trapelia coarctata]
MQPYHTRFLYDAEGVDLFSSLYPSTPFPFHQVTHSCYNGLVKQIKNTPPTPPAVAIRPPSTSPSHSHEALHLAQPLPNADRSSLGGRTAWSSTVTISPPSSHSQQTLQARYWYDGQYVHNAKEDAAEVAFRTLTSGRSSSTSVSSGSGSGGYSAAMSGAMSPGGSYASAGWSAGSSARQSQDQASVGGSGAWPGSSRASRWGSIGGG